MNDRPFSRREMLALMAAAMAGSCFAQAGLGSGPAMPNSIAWPPERIPKDDLGVEQQPNDELAWMLDAKFGMFIHWGLYSGPGRGEWYMYDQGIKPDVYARFARPEAGDEYFSADRYDPAHWAEVAKAAGMRWMCLTARHHEGFCLFDSPHPNAFTSVQTLRRDLVREYVDACRRARLKVGLYYSPLSWRYPGYFDVTGTDCKPNNFGYTTDIEHKENARLMKEENYANVRHLMSAYGHIDHVFWDGGWLAQQGSDADAAFFHEPGLHMNPTNAWQVDPKYVEYDSAGRALGIMGLVRKHQANIIANSRYGWIGDIKEEEGGGPPTGPLRTSDQWDKCITPFGSWGYNKGAIERGAVMTVDRMIEYLANCVVRNMVLLLNFGPDRHGIMPPIIEERLRAVGAWLSKASEAIYKTRGGPWNPVDGQYGFCYKDDTVYAHIFKGYTNNAFTLPAIGPLNVTRAHDVIAKKDLRSTVNSDRTVTISGIDRSASPIDTIIAVRFDRPVMTYAQRS